MVESRVQERSKSQRLDPDPPLAEEHHGLSHLLLDDHVWAWRLSLVLWAIAASLLIAVAIPPVRDVIFEFDEWFYDTTYPVKIAWVTKVARFLSFVGSGVFVWPLRAIVTAYLASQKRWQAVAAWVLAIVVSEPFIWILKNAYGRERPPLALVDTASASFPSGHAIGGAVLAVGLVVAFVPAGPARRNMEMVAAGFALLMSASRVYLGAHYLTDVVAGVAFGAAVAIWAAVVVHRFYLRRFVREREEALQALQSRSAGGA
jgi:undecaprenyl-diphosphatase